MGRTTHVPSAYKIEGYPAVEVLAQALVDAGFSVSRTYPGRGDRWVDVWDNGKTAVVFEVWPSDRYCEVYRVVKESIRTAEVVEEIHKLAHKD